MPAANSAVSPLKRLLAALPEGVAAPSAWLAAQGVSPQLARKYVAGGWLLPLGHGVYGRPGTVVDWQGVVLGVQRLAGAAVHVGGLSALNLQSLAHYLPLGGEPVIHLWRDDDSARLPSWVRRAGLQAALRLHRERLFAGDAAGQGLKALPSGIRDWKLAASAPERAILEVLAGVDESAASFAHAAELFGNLAVARPAVAQALLEGCTSVKAKRLFLFLAARHDFPWCRRLRLERIDLGRGKRLVTRGGRFDARFGITYPESLDAGRG